MPEKLTPGKVKESMRIGLRVARNSLGLLAVLVGLACQSPRTPSSTSAAAADWPQYRGPNRDGVSGETGWLGQWPQSGPQVLWRTSVGAGFCSFAVSGGRVYTMGNVADVDTVYCFDAQSGQVLWKHSYPCPILAKLHEGGPCGTPTVDGDRVYTLSKAGHLFCLDAASGRQSWSKDLQRDFSAPVPEWGHSCSPLALKESLIVHVGGQGASVVAFDKKTGEVRWQAGNDRVAYSSPVIFQSGDTYCLACFLAPALVVLNAANGQEICRYRWRTEYDVNAATPIVTSSGIFISSGYNSGCALLRPAMGSASPVWQNRNMRNHFNSCVLWQGHLYGFDESELRCLALQDGSVKWSQGGLGKGSLMVADGKLIILSEGGELAIAEASPAGYKQLARGRILSGKCWTVPVLSGGRVYARNANGDVVCVDVKGNG